MSNLHFYYSRQNLETHQLFSSMCFVEPTIYLVTRFSFWIEVKFFHLDARELLSLSNFLKKKKKINSSTQRQILKCRFTSFSRLFLRHDLGHVKFCNGLFDEYLWREFLWSKNNSLGRDQNSWVSPLVTGSSDVLTDKRCLEKKLHQTKTEKSNWLSF